MTTLACLARLAVALEKTISTVHELLIGTHSDSEL